MFIITAKLTRKKLAAAIAAAGAVLIGIIVLLAWGGGRAAAVETGAVRNIKTNDDRVAYLTGLGWTVEADPVETQDVLIPAQWDATMEHYECLQKDQGMSLERYKNKHVTRYVYRVLNHPSGESEVFACLLIYKNRIVGGCVQSNALNGFMHKLTGP
ncbi:MAG: DUF4830 domain-containing protein [Oscillospiraceae bacterium]|nr:DUF4830 domain-containing protein [Oscillospiraceae bacterium]